MRQKESMNCIHLSSFEAAHSLIDHFASSSISTHDVGDQHDELGLEMTVPIKMECRQDSNRQVTEEDEDWIQGGKCLLRPCTAVIHCTFICPCYLVSAIVLVIVIFMRGLLQCLRVLPSNPGIQSRENEPNNNRPTIFFDGAGWAFPFSLGVSKFIIDNYDVPQSSIYAISAGNIAAICLLLNKDPTIEIRQHYGDLRRAAVYSHIRQPLFGYFSTLQHVRDTIDKLVPDNIHTIASGRYHAVVTPWPHLGLRFVSSFASKREFVDAVVASMAVPPFVYRPLISRHAGWPGLWVDGGLQAPRPTL